MFLCESCTHPSHKDRFMFNLLSKGPCENCGYTDTCIDIWSGTPGPLIDPNWEANVQKDLERLNADRARGC